MMKRKKRYKLLKKTYENSDKTIEKVYIRGYNIKEGKKGCNINKISIKWKKIQKNSKTHIPKQIYIKYYKNVIKM